ncbi:MAG: glycosyltransferase family 2 protein [Alphaproteobacteria bacterium]|nr:glycosyltransferase family 2 protein [Alphaproteobacteria bacterium]
MFVDIIVPCYNKGFAIRQALESILNQKTDRIKNIIVSDDGSTDNSVEVIRQVQAEHPGRIDLHAHPTNLGAIGCHNFLYALAQCQSDYIAGLDGDDLYLDENKIETMAKILDEYPDYIGCVHDSTYISRDGVHFPNKIIKEHFAENIVHINTTEIFIKFLNLALAMHPNFVMLRRMTWHNIFTIEFAEYYLKSCLPDSYRFQIFNMLGNGEKMVFINKNMASITTSPTSFVTNFGELKIMVMELYMHLIFTEYYKSSPGMLGLLDKLINFNVKKIKIYSVS